MSAKNLRKLAKTIENETNFFNMDGFYNMGYGKGEITACGTPSCVCGWANYLSTKESQSDYHKKRFEREFNYARDVMMDEGEAIRWMGISQPRGRSLFYDMGLTRDDVVEKLNDWADRMEAGHDL